MSKLYKKGDPKEFLREVKNKIDDLTIGESVAINAEDEVEERYVEKLVYKIEEYLNDIGYGVSWTIYDDSDEFDILVNTDNKVLEFNVTEDEFKEGNLESDARNIADEIDSAMIED